MNRRRIQILSSDDSDPMLSSINLVDVFLVALAILMIALMNHPLADLASGDFTLIRDEGKPTMEIIVKQGKQLSRFQSTGLSSEGNGTEAGTAYRMKDGSMVYVPKSNPSDDKHPSQP